MMVRILDGTHAHAAFTAWVALEASRSHLPRGFWDFYLDQDTAGCLRYLEVLATTSRPHLFHHSAFLVAEVGGTPAAALCGYFDEELGYNAMLAMDPEVDARLSRPPEANEAGLARNQAFFTVTPEHPPRTWIVENVATRPEFRRRGLVDQLLEEVLKRGSARGARIADIGVFIGNDPAQRAYEKAGFRFASEKRNDELERTWGTPGIRLLRRELT
ncbi:MAG TPA: GNAT family N-acetyltransferase [Myxococcota bacterium]|nr:GNAT family N-acetyltransferase [Myxococcota bacterium]